MKEQMKRKCKISCCPLDEAICSIALEAAGIAHILNAEGEKIQKAIQSTTCIEDLLRVNASVQNTIIDVTSLESVLFNKLRIISNIDCECSCASEDNGSLCLYVYSCFVKNPLSNICVKVYNDISELIDNAETDEFGKYCLSDLQYGNYKVVLINQNSCEKECFDFSISETQERYCKQICFKACSQNSEKLINISGIVIDSYGAIISNATVVVEGLNVAKVNTNEYGKYEIKNVNIENCFSIYAECQGVFSKTYKNENPIRTNYSCKLKINI